MNIKNERGKGDQGIDRLSDEMKIEREQLFKS